MAQIDSSPPLLLGVSPLPPPPLLPSLQPLTLPSHPRFLSRSPNLSAPHPSLFLPRLLRAPSSLCYPLFLYCPPLLGSGGCFGSTGIVHYVGVPPAHYLVLLILPSRSPLASPAPVLGTVRLFRLFLVSPVLRLSSPILLPIPPTSRVACRQPPLLWT